MGIRHVIRAHEGHGRIIEKCLFMENCVIRIFRSDSGNCGWAPVHTIFHHQFIQVKDSEIMLFEIPDPTMQTMSEQRAAVAAIAIAAFQIGKISLLLSKLLQSIFLHSARLTWKSSMRCVCTLYNHMRSIDITWTKSLHRKTKQKNTTTANIECFGFCR